MEELLVWLQDIFANELSNDSWEHEHQIQIFTLDNPGWRFEFDLRDTTFENFPTKEFINTVDDNNWYYCSFKEGFFVGQGGVKNLVDILAVFKAWYIDASKKVDSS